MCSRRISAALIASWLVASAAGRAPASTSVEDAATEATVLVAEAAVAATSDVLDASEPDADEVRCKLEDGGRLHPSCSPFGAHRVDFDRNCYDQNETTIICLPRWAGTVVTSIVCLSRPLADGGVEAFWSGADPYHDDASDVDRCKGAAAAAFSEQMPACDAD